MLLIQSDKENEKYFFSSFASLEKPRKLRSSSESTLSHSKIIIRRETMNTGIKVDGVTILVKKKSMLNTLNGQLKTNALLSEKILNNKECLIDNVEKDY